MSTEIPQTEEFTPLSDEPSASMPKSPSILQHPDDETVSSAPPRLEVNTKINVNDGMSSEKQVSEDKPSLTIVTQDVTHDEASVLSTPTFSATHREAAASTNKFVTFLSDVDTTPIAQNESYAEKDVVSKVRQSSIDEGADEDEKKEEASPNNDQQVRLKLESIEDIDSSSVRSSVEPTQPLSTVLESISTPSRVAIPTIPAHSPSRLHVATPGRRSITLRLLEEIHHDVSQPNSNNGLTPFKRLNLRRFRSLSLSTVMIPDEKGIDMTNRSNNNTSGNNTDKDNGNKKETLVDRGTIAVSWYDGTTSSEMQEHVYNCVLRKLNDGNGGSEKKKLEDVRLLDESSVPHDEVVLCPFLPHGSHFLLQFKISKPQSSPKQQHRDLYSMHRIPPYISRAPDSPSAEQSPYPSSANLNGLNNNAVNAQLQLLNAATALLQSNGIKTQGVLGQNGLSFGIDQQQQSHHQQANFGLLPRLPVLPSIETVPREFKEQSTRSKEEVKLSPNYNMNSTDALIEEQLRKLNQLFLLRNGGSADGINANSSQRSSGEVEQEEEHDSTLVNYYQTQEKKQVIFIIANYLLFFMSLIAISAEIQSRLPQWMNWVQDNYDSVQNCATDHDALFECISNGNFSGLVASIILWATQSASAKRIFLFGFDTPKKLWTVVYEALVTAVCWGLSYIFIRRGLNPNTREKFIQKYWKDAVYGSLAGFNAAFMKAVLKNLVPQDVALQAIETRQLKIFNWLGMLMSEE